MFGFKKNKKTTKKTDGAQLEIETMQDVLSGKTNNEPKKAPPKDFSFFKNKKKSVISKEKIRTVEKRKEIKSAPVQKLDSFDSKNTTQTENKNNQTKNIPVKKPFIKPAPKITTNKKSEVSDVKEKSKPAHVTPPKITPERKIPAPPQPQKKESSFAQSSDKNPLARLYGQAKAAPVSNDGDASVKEPLSDKVEKEAPKEVKPAVIKEEKQVEKPAPKKEKESPALEKVILPFEGSREALSSNDLFKKREEKKEEDLSRLIKKPEKEELNQIDISAKKPEIKTKQKESFAEKKQSLARPFIAKPKEDPLKKGETKKEVFFSSDKKPLSGSSPKTTTPPFESNNVQKKSTTPETKKLDKEKLSSPEPKRDFFKKTEKESFSSAKKISALTEKIKDKKTSTENSPLELSRQAPFARLYGQPQKEEKDAPTKSKEQESAEKEPIQAKKKKVFDFLLKKEKVDTKPKNKPLKKEPVETIPKKPAPTMALPTKKDISDKQKEERKTPIKPATKIDSSVKKVAEKPEKSLSPKNPLARLYGQAKAAPVSNDGDASVKEPLSDKVEKEAPKEVKPAVIKEEKQVEKPAPKKEALSSHQKQKTPLPKKETFSLGKIEKVETPKIRKEESPKKIPSLSKKDKEDKKIKEIENTIEKIEALEKEFDKMETEKTHQNQPESKKEEKELQKEAKPPAEIEEKPKEEKEEEQKKSPSAIVKPNKKPEQPIHKQSPVKQQIKQESPVNKKEEEVTTKNEPKIKEFSSIKEQNTEQKPEQKISPAKDKETVSSNSKLMSGPFFEAETVSKEGLSEKKPGTSTNSTVLSTELEKDRHLSEEKQKLEELKSKNKKPTFDFTRKKKTSQDLNIPLLIFAIIILLATIGSGYYYYKKLQKGSSSDEFSLIPEIELSNPIKDLLPEEELTKEEPNTVLQDAKAAEFDKTNLKQSILSYVNKIKNEPKQAVNLRNGFFIKPTDLSGTPITANTFLSLFEINIEEINQDLDGEMFFFIIRNQKVSPEEPTTVKLNLFLKIKTNQKDSLAKEMKLIEPALPEELLALYIDEDSPSVPSDVSFSSVFTKSNISSQVHYFNYEQNNPKKSIEWSIFSVNEFDYLGITTSKHSSDMMILSFE